MKTAYIVICIFIFNASFGQAINEGIEKSIIELEKDKQFAHAIISLYIVEGKSGKTVFEKNAQLGLAPASCQKIVTSAVIFELLGKDYRYKTPVKIYKATDSIRLFIEGSGDPTLGSWRWESTKMNRIYQHIHLALQNFRVSELGTDISIIENKFDQQPVPDGWVWQDIGNYYGAGISAFNWHENLYDLVLSSGNNEGDPTEIKSFDPPTAAMFFSNYITTGKKGTGDNAYIYAAPKSKSAFATGTIPPAQKNFKISGSMTDPSNTFINGLKFYLHENDINISGGSNTGFLSGSLIESNFETIHTIVSPVLDSINYWFLQKSVNLYGEAFVKTIACEKKGIGSTAGGIAIIKDFWDKRGIESSSLNIIDGSGLSPANRVTSYALVKILQYAKDKPWFSSFYHALPLINGIKMKDGYIGGVRSYSGFIRNKAGIDYTFSFIVNNFDGNPSAIREKMWKILDLLK